MTLWKNYYLAESILAALQALSEAGDPSRLIAGGTDLLLDLQQGRHSPVHTLVDVTSIPELNTIEIRGEQLFVGAAVPLTQIVASPLLQYHGEALVEACALIGGPQVRNTATLGGNVSHALPAGDGTIALLALDAQAEVASIEGHRFVPTESLFLGPGKSSLDPRKEILVGFYLPLVRPRQASAFRRVMRPQGVALPILNAAIWLFRTEDRIAEIRVAIGPAGPRPLRARETENALCGKRLTPDVVESAFGALLSEARFRTSPQRASAGYRRHLAEVLLEETLQAAWNRAANDNGLKPMANG
ncbi:MAG TPA: xanthine dehydrogenase family protein subunit M [Anaerolineales bacterium]